MASRVGTEAGRLVAAYRGASELVEGRSVGLLFANPVAFNRLYGHRSDVQGFYGARARSRSRGWVDTLTDLLPHPFTPRDLTHA